MSTREYRHIVIDDLTVVEMENGKAHILDDRRAKMLLRALGLTKEPVLVPDRSFELATDQTSQDKRVTGVALQLLSILAEYTDPLSSAALGQLLTDMNPNTLSSRLSFLKKGGFINAAGVPSQYMVTGKGHAALVDAKAVMDGPARAQALASVAK